MRKVKNSGTPPRKQNSVREGSQQGSSKPTRRGSKNLKKLMGVGGRKEESRNNNSSTSSIESRSDSKSSFVQRLRSDKESREKVTKHERIQELHDQNQYLVEKVQFLRLQKMRNESEMKRMDSKQRELKKMQDNYEVQMKNIEELIGEWQQFHTNVTSVADSWGNTSQQATVEKDQELVQATVEKNQELVQATVEKEAHEFV